MDFTRDTSLAVGLAEAGSAICCSLLSGMTLPLENVPLSRAAKLRREDEYGEDTEEGLHA